MMTKQGFVVKKLFFNFSFKVTSTNLFIAQSSHPSLAVEDRNLE